MRKILVLKLMVLCCLVPVIIVSFFAGTLFAALTGNYGMVKVIPSDRYYEKYGRSDCQPLPPRYEF